MWRVKYFIVRRFWWSTSQFKEVFNRRIVLFNEGKHRQMWVELEYFGVCRGVFCQRVALPFMLIPKIGSDVTILRKTNIYRQSRKQQ